jgi:hypothetical protein
LITEDSLVEALAGQRFDRLDKLLILVAALPQPTTVAAIMDRAVECGLGGIRKWNVSQYLGRANQLVRKLPLGWQLTEQGRERVRQLGLSTKSPLVGGTAQSLRALVEKLADQHRREFLYEALLCFDRGANRAAVVYSWVGAAWILQNFIVSTRLAAFNEAGDERFNKTKETFAHIKTVESFGRMSDGDLLTLLEDIGDIGKSLHRQLRERLNLRNDCGHPNTMIVDEHTCAAHINFLIENVYRRY